MRRSITLLFLAGLGSLEMSSGLALAGDSRSLIEGGVHCESGEGKCAGDADAQGQGSEAVPVQVPLPPPAPAPAAATGPSSSRYALPLLGAYRKTMEIEDQIQHACERWSVPRPLARAVCMYESGGDDLLTSGAGAHGYFQVMPQTFRLMRVDTNIEAGVKYLGSLVAEFGREDDALAAYNGGPGRVKKGRPMPIESLQYVVGVGIYRTLLTWEEPRIREEAGQLDIHRVLAGETWQSLAESTGVPLLDLRLYNPYLAMRPLKPGAIVALPRPGTFRFVGGDGDAGPRTYETRRGDNYLLLAFAFDVDLDGFRKENTLWRVQPPFEGLKLALTPRSHPADAAGATSIAALPALTVPEQPAAEAQASPTSDRPSSDPRGSKEIVHRVRPGDTLDAIARTYGVSVSSIRKVNKLKHSRLRVGQVLRIPAA